MTELTLSPAHGMDDTPRRCWISRRYNQIN
jgi:hypothetical protein